MSNKVRRMLAGVLTVSMVSAVAPQPVQANAMGVVEAISDADEKTIIYGIPSLASPVSRDWNKTTTMETIKSELPTRLQIRYDPTGTHWNIYADVTWELATIDGEPISLDSPYLDDEFVPNGNTTIGFKPIFEDKYELAEGFEPYREIYINQYRLTSRLSVPTSLYYLSLDRTTTKEDVETFIDEVLPKTWRVQTEDKDGWWDMPITWEFAEQQWGSITIGSTLQFNAVYHEDYRRNTTSANLSSSTVEPTVSVGIKFFDNQIVAEEIIFPDVLQNQVLPIGYNSSPFLPSSATVVTTEGRVIENIGITWIENHGRSFLTNNTNSYEYYPVISNNSYVYSKPLTPINVDVVEYGDNTIFSSIQLDSGISTQYIQQGSDTEPILPDHVTGLNRFGEFVADIPVTWVCTTTTKFTTDTAGTHTFRAIPAEGYLATDVLSTIRVQVMSNPTVTTPIEIASINLDNVVQFQQFSMGDKLTPNLPSRVNALTSSGSTINLPVTWREEDGKTFNTNEANTFTYIPVLSSSYTTSATLDKIEVEVLEAVIPDIEISSVVLSESVLNQEIEVYSSGRPSLPTSVTAVTSDGNKTLSVTWNEVDNRTFNTTGVSTFTYEMDFGKGYVTTEEMPQIQVKVVPAELERVIISTVVENQVVELGSNDRPNLPSTLLGVRKNGVHVYVPVTWTSDKTFTTDEETTFVYSAHIDIDDVTFASTPQIQVAVKNFENTNVIESINLEARVKSQRIEVGSGQVPVLPETVNVSFRRVIETPETTTSSAFILAPGTNDNNEVSVTWVEQSGSTFSDETSQTFVYVPVFGDEYMVSSNIDRITVTVYTNGSTEEDNNGSTDGDNSGSTGGNNGSTDGDNSGSTGGNNNGNTDEDNKVEDETTTEDDKTEVEDELTTEDDKTEVEDESTTEDDKTEVEDESTTEDDKTEVEDELTTEDDKTEVEDETTTEVEDELTTEDDKTDEPSTTVRPSISFRPNTNKDTQTGQIFATPTSENQTVVKETTQPAPQTTQTPAVTQTVEKPQTTEQANKFVNPFNDVKTGAWYFADVMNVYVNQLISGITESTFEPSTNTTRGMVATILHRLDGNNTVSKKNGFADIGEKWYTDAIDWATKVNVFNGFEDNTFRPYDDITREQLVVALHNYAVYRGVDGTISEDVNKFDDSTQVSYWSKTAMEWAVGNNIIGGREDNTLDPKGVATRAEISAIVNRFVEQVL